jgi:dolichol-phosphate mannosyltransferase
MIPDPRDVASFSDDWEIPTFDEAVFTARRHDVALVIPVINEGDRIRDQLQRLRQLDFPIDIVIADGGSSDGSLEHDFLRETGVRALLVKTSPGRLSAQLRMAYAWCLLQGYGGVVTMDGNGKDGVAAVAGFIARLDEGYDFIQGSRFIEGGEAVNTPLDRALAAKFIHAPLISLAAGKRFTDTTNGFRGYSARALRDPRVATFRDVFSEYALLFYLSARIPALGYRTCEIPVRRSYPKEGARPTKISGLRGRVRMMGELLRVVTGSFNPD